MKKENEGKQVNIQEKTIDDMLVEFSLTEYFKLLETVSLKFHAQILEKLQIANPNEVADIAKLQGEIQGLYDFINHVKMVKEKRSEKKEEAERANS